MAKCMIEETQIVSKESRTSQSVEQRNDFVQILHALASSFLSNLRETDSPLSQLRPLAGDYIFVENNQPARRTAFL